MTSMLPVINELEGSIERNDMGSQMKLLAQRVDELSPGMPKVIQKTVDLQYTQ